MKAVIMCGGKGSRLRPLTESLPKPLIKLFGRPVIDIIVEKLINSGIEEIYLSLGYMSNELIEYCETKPYGKTVRYIVETKPLGTAGGVKNCCKTTDDDLLILSGDNIFDFDINKIISFHLNSDADVTVCGIETDDPREYGVIVSDETGKINSFVEKPDWEQANGTTVNTGIYLLKGKILEMIPSDTFYDFANGLFPEMLKRGMRLMCCRTNGYWGDMGEFASYRKILRDILDGKFNDEIIKVKKIVSDVSLDNGTFIVAPCTVGNDVKIGNNCKIGPYCTIENNVSVGDNCLINSSVIGADSVIERNCDIRSAIIGDVCKIYDNCCIEENAVVGFGCNVGRFTRISGNSKIWPGKSILPESVICGDILYETPSVINFDVYGVSGRINSQITLPDAGKLGQAIASIKNISKIGIGCDGNNGSQVYKDILLCGVRSCGKDAYDFGDMFRQQAVFYAAYCSLDFFVFVSLDGDIIKLSFFGKYGMPVSKKTAKEINNIYRYSTFDFSKETEYKDVYNMKLFSTVYISYLKKLFGKYDAALGVYFETENSVVKNLLREMEVFNSKKINVQLLINQDVTDMYLIENEKFYSYEKVVALLTELAMAENKKVIIPENSPLIIEENAEKYNAEILRVYENSENYSVEKSEVLENLFSFDPIVAAVKIIGIVKDTGITIEKLFEYQKDFVVRRAVIDFDGSPCEIRPILDFVADKSSYNGIYYEINRRNGKVRLRQMGNANRIRMLVDALDMESAKELSVFVSEKIKNANIDKGNQKL